MEELTEFKNEREGYVTVGRRVCRRTSAPNRVGPPPKPTMRRLIGKQSWNKKKARGNKRRWTPTKAGPSVAPTRRKRVRKTKKMSEESSRSAELHPPQSKALDFWSLNGEMKVRWWSKWQEGRDEEGRPNGLKERGGGVGFLCWMKGEGAFGLGEIRVVFDYLQPKICYSVLF